MGRGERHLRLDGGGGLSEVSAESLTTRSQGRVGSGARPFQQEGTASAKTARQEEAWRRPFLPRNLPSEELLSSLALASQQHNTAQSILFHRSCAPGPSLKYRKSSPFLNMANHTTPCLTFPLTPLPHTNPLASSKTLERRRCSLPGPFPSSLHCSHFHKLQATLTSHIKGFQGRGSINHLIQTYI